MKAWLSFLLLALAAYGAYSGWRNYRLLEEASQAATSGSAAENAAGIVGRSVEPFVLTERSGQKFDSRELSGKPWVASFFFTSCAGACLKMNNIVAQLQQDPELAGLRFVSITVDPENDTPEELEKYARHYKADLERWLFLTGPPDEIRHLANEVFLVAYGREAHSDRLIVVDGQGKIAGMYRAMVDAEVIKMKKKLRELSDVDAGPNSAAGPDKAAASPEEPASAAAAN